MVGHEPGFSHFVTRLLTEKETGFEMEWKKAGVCALDVDWAFSKPRTILLWHLAPRQLRVIAKNQWEKLSHQSKTSAKR